MVFPVDVRLYDPLSCSLVFIMISASKCLQLARQPFRKGYMMSCVLLQKQLLIFGESMSETQPQ